MHYGQEGLNVARRYLVPSAQCQARSLLAHVEAKGAVLDCFTAAGNAVSIVLTAHSVHVTTNDFDPRCV